MINYNNSIFCCGSREVVGGKQLGEGGKIENGGEHSIPYQFCQSQRLYACTCTPTLPPLISIPNSILCIPFPPTLKYASFSFFHSPFSILRSNFSAPRNNCFSLPPQLLANSFCNPLFTIFASQLNL